MAKTTPELIWVDNDVDEVCCDGGNSALGHPAVWYSFSKSDSVVCGYCGRQFAKKRSKASGKGKKSVSA